MRWVALTFLVAGCTFGTKYYLVDTMLPNGDPPASGFWVPYYQRGVILTVPGLDVRVSGDAEHIAQWFSPWPLPPIIPVPSDRWDHPANATVTLTVQPHRTGWTLLPSRSRLRPAGGAPVPPSSWSGPVTFESLRGAPRSWKPPATHEASEPVIIEADSLVHLEFPTQSPLEATAELQLAGLMLDGREVELPAVGLAPRYEEHGATIP